MKIRVKSDVKIPQNVPWLSHDKWYTVVEGTNLRDDCQCIKDDDGELIIVNADGVSLCGHLGVIGGWEVDHENNDKDDSEIKIGDYVRIIAEGWEPCAIGDIVEVVEDGGAGEKHFVANGFGEISAIRRYPNEFQKVEKMEIEE